MTRDPPDREPAADLDLDHPANPWNRLATGLLDEPSEVPVTYESLLALLWAEAIVAAAEARWLGLED